MQHSQLYFTGLILGCLLVLPAAAPPPAATMAHPAKPDPLLDGGPTAPCAEGPDYVAGADVNGAAVAPADIGAPKVPVPDAISVPLHAGRQARRPNSRFAPPQMPGETPYVTLDGRRLEPLLNPRPCR